jgi:hypothetical protein
MSPMPPPEGIAGPFCSSLISDIRASVVSSKAAIDAAFCNAVRVTFVGSMTPAATRSSYTSVSALNPKSVSLLWRTLSTTTAPSYPELLTICRSGSSRARRRMLIPIASSPSSFSFDSGHLKTRTSYTGRGEPSPVRSSPTLPEDFRFIISGLQRITSWTAYLRNPASSGAGTQKPISMPTAGATG